MRFIKFDKTMQRRYIPLEKTRNGDCNLIFYVPISYENFHRCYLFHTAKKKLDVSFLLNFKFKNFVTVARLYSSSLFFRNIYVISVSLWRVVNSGADKMKITQCIHFLRIPKMKFELHI